MSAIVYGKLPVYVGHFEFDLAEVMYYLYLPVKMDGSSVLMPPNVEVCRPAIDTAIKYAEKFHKKTYRYAYISARKGYATPDNPLNRPGWHCDGFGTDDLNFVWWVGPGTRFAHQVFEGICSDHNRSLNQFNEQVNPKCVVNFPARGLYAIDPSVVHATPVIEPPGCMRQYVKISMSDHQYNLENNSHNYLFNYDWKLHARDAIRNDPAKAQLDYAA